VKLPKEELQEEMSRNLSVCPMNKISCDKLCMAVTHSITLTKKQGQCCKIAAYGWRLFGGERRGSPTVVVRDGEQKGRVLKTC